MLNKERIYVVGYDCDGNLYQATPKIDSRVRNKIAEKIMEKDPKLKNVEMAREFFEQRYKILQSGSKILAEAGYENPARVMDECLATANILDLIEEDTKLAEIIHKINDKFLTFLLTSSPEKLTLAKLERIGINPYDFDYRFYSDTPNVGSKNDGSAFENALKKIKLELKDCVYIGDRKNSDIIPAKNLGMQTIAVWSEIPEADVSIKHIHELESLLL